MIIEVCAESYEHALMAEKAGADRIELCKDLHLDGLTPDYESAKKTIDSLELINSTFLSSSCASFPLPTDKTFLKILKFS